MEAGVRPYDQGAGRGRRIPFVFRYWRDVAECFGDEKSFVEPSRAGDEFSAEEIAKIFAMVRRMGVDFGMLDVLRSTVDGQIYVVDVNSTPTGPSPAVCTKARLQAMAELSDSSFVSNSCNRNIRACAHVPTSSDLTDPFPPEHGDGSTHRVPRTAAASAVNPPGGRVRPLRQAGSLSAETSDNLSAPSADRHDVVPSGRGRRRRRRSAAVGAAAAWLLEAHRRGSRAASVFQPAVGGRPEPLEFRWRRQERPTTQPVMRAREALPEPAAERQRHQRRRILPAGAHQRLDRLGDPAVFQTLGGLPQTEPALRPAEKPRRQMGMVEAGHEHDLIMTLTHRAEILGHAVAAAAIAGQQRRHYGELVALRQRQEQHEILASSLQAFVEAANLQHASAPDQWRAGGCDEVVQQQQCMDAARVAGGDVSTGEAAVTIQKRGPAVDQPAILARTAQRRDLPRQLVRMPEIVGIEGRDQRAARMCESEVAGRGRAAVGLLQQPDAEIALRQVGGDHGGPVARAVVDDQHFKFAMSLGERRRYGFAKR